MNDALIDWLLDADPAIRWQVMRDLLDEPEDTVGTERAKVAVEGWGARLLGLQGSDGNWGGGPWAYQSWMSTMETLMVLRELGVDPDSPACRAATSNVREKSEWGEYHSHAPFFDGESEPCINGRVLACAAYFDRPNEALLARLLNEQLEDGGWNCDAPESERSSFNTTICVLEGLLEHERATGSADSTRAARARGQEYLLERRLFRSLSSGQAVERDRKSGRDWRELSFPTRWRYDVLWALDYLRRAAVEPDDRLSEPLDLLLSRRRGDGTWAIDHVHDGADHFRMERGAGQASRWVTLRALRVLRWAGAES